LLYSVVLMAKYDIGFKLLVPAVDGHCQSDLLLFLNLNTCADQHIIFGRQHRTRIEAPVGLYIVCELIDKNPLSFSYLNKHLLKELVKM
jgi:hypothetical protein